MSAELTTIFVVRSITAATGVSYGFRWLQKKKSKGLRSGKREDQATGRTHPSVSEWVTFDFRLSIWELEPRQIPPSHIWHLRVPCAAVLGSVVQEVWPLREGPMAYEEVGSRNTIGSVSIGL
ncbi:hypothetical protein TNCV_1186361 [Trichonephila clavipes]|nr:hypothetical protein TNCV_1186361 [Trichonephila clavipes]